MDYGYMVYGSASKTIIDKLNVIKHRGLRIAIGAFKTSPLITIHTEADVLPLLHWRRILLCNWLRRTQQLTLDHTTLQLLTTFLHIENWRIKYNNIPFIITVELNWHVKV